MITIGALGLLCGGAIRLVGQWSMPWLSYMNGARK
jgi:NitT/TauT family transport system permease protein